MKLEQIGFYTLSDKRAENASEFSRLSRCEILLTGQCNFHCPYCRSVGGPDKPFEEAATLVRTWAADGLYAIRFSGGEPLMYPRLKELVELAKAEGIPKIAISSNGSFPLKKYMELIAAGVNDFSISLDACCAEDGDFMAGGIKGAFDRVSANIEALSKVVYVTVGIVLTTTNAASVSEIIKFAARLGVQDIRVIPAAQAGDKLGEVVVSAELLERYPILRYRIQNLHDGKPVRGLRSCDSHSCGLVLDDMAVSEGHHYPCIIYLREGGLPIGSITDPYVRHDRASWHFWHDTHKDPICRKNCLDVCVDYNNRFESFRDK
jgi:molybdenum cofactor biosynthesis enzyme MoaA